MQEEKDNLDSQPDALNADQDGAQVPKEKWNRTEIGGITPSGTKNNIVSDTNAVDIAALVGEKLGEYVLQNKIGEGGMAVVYEAFQESLKRFVAVKVLDPKISSQSSFTERFFREARAVASLHHPNIIQVYYLGQEKGLYYFAMELVQGKSLKEELAKRRMLPGRKGMFDAEESIEIIGNLCNALEHVHKKNIIHRDIKPENIMLSGQRILLTDFGLYMEYDPEKGMADKEIIGTPYYLAPEVIKGDRLGLFTDIYSLGIVWYEILQGVPPFEGQTIRELFDKIKQSKADDIEGIPAGLNRIIMKCITKNPLHRYQTIGEMQKDISNFLGGKSISAIVTFDEKTQVINETKNLAAEDVYYLVQKSRLYRKLTFLFFLGIVFALGLSVFSYLYYLRHQEEQAGIKGKTVVFSPPDQK